MDAVGWDPTGGTTRELLPVGRALFVGRRQELEELLAALDEASEGSGGLVLIGGGPGIGGGAGKHVHVWP